jgi:aminopeptidase
MINKAKLEKFAKIAVQVGANVQKDQLVWINSSTETRNLAHYIVEEAYKVGAKKVVVNWSDDYVSHSGLQYQSLETLESVDDWLIQKYKSFIEEGGCVISITSPIPGLNADIDPTKLQAASMAKNKAFQFYQTHMMGNKSQWTIVAAPNDVWAQRVFPNKTIEDAVEALWDAILTASRVTDDNDPVEEWNKHNERLLKYNKILNDLKLESLHFENEFGTDLTIKLVDNHIWAGGGEHSTNGTYFNPNIPTEENFTMPYKYGVNGKVYATMPLNYQGNLIEDFWLEFKDGKVIDYDAKKQKSALKNLLEFDEGSSYLGEVALVSHYSPISQMGILFFNTLFDENASCHLALGRAYPMNIEGGNDMTKDDLDKAGSNYSMVHSDFMFGSAGMNITGTKPNGETIAIFKNGEFVI